MCNVYAYMCLSCFLTCVRSRAPLRHRGYIYDPSTRRHANGGSGFQSVRLSKWPIHTYMARLEADWRDGMS
ncbi:hypothetical protein F4859DRAFT_81620 [Xylaria cf. heliscus]|nr:hypothetical protein F4859DRAFT_81620 [Xylaria cf. heliscus]